MSVVSVFLMNNDVIVYFLFLAICATLTGIHHSDSSNLYRSTTCCTSN